MAVKVNANSRFSADSFLERFSRQMKIPNWGEAEQKKIFDRKILILGDGPLGEMVLAGLATFGARNLFYQDYQDSPHEKSYFSRASEQGTRLEKIVHTVARINPYARILGYHAPFTKIYMAVENFIPDVVIDATNDFESKEIAMDYVSNNPDIKFISGVSNETSCAVSFYDFKRRDGNYREILAPKIKSKRGMQGGFTSTIAAGLIIEEFRKSVFQLNEQDDNLRETIYYNLNSGNRTSPDRDSDSASLDCSSWKRAKILLAGCGGIGNYAGLGLAQEGFRNIFFLDRDIVEDTNLNRQMFFYDDVGERKNVSLSRKINKTFRINPKILLGELNKDSEELFRTNKFDLILGCFDNANARLFLNDYAMKSGVPYIDGATTYKSGQIDIYVPGRTVCIQCKRGLVLQETVTDNSCDNSAPSVISPNMIIGSGIVGETIRYFSERHEDIRLSYNSESRGRISTHNGKTKSKRHDCFSGGEK